MVFTLSATAQVPKAPPAIQLAKVFPQQVDDFRLQGYRPQSSLTKEIKPEDFGVARTAEATYLSASGEKFLVEIAKSQTDSGAYALLTAVMQPGQEAAPAQTAKLDGVGTAAFVSPERLAFFKGATFVSIKGQEEAERRALAQSLSETLDNGTGEIPVLVKHLPDWETAQERASYVLSLPALQKAVGNQPVLEAISFEGGAEAVTATYSPTMRLVIVEHSTPQFAAETDTRIKQQIQQLGSHGQPVPSAYRRVGNYSVFVFDAPHEEAAVQLVKGVKYEKDVRWLGQNPHVLERAVKAYTSMTAGVIVATLKATGVAILLCLGIGSMIGAAFFLRRRKQAAIADNYSDAGGMVRLNIDDLTAQNNPARLLGRGDG